MGNHKDLNEPAVYAEGLYLAATTNDPLALAKWLANDEAVEENPFFKWFDWFARRLIDLAPRPERGFQARATQPIPPPKIGRNDVCPCGSGKKYKKCHLGQEDAVSWKMGNPTPVIHSMATVRIIQEMPLAALAKVPLDKTNRLVRAELSQAYQRFERYDQALPLLKGILDLERDDPHLLYDYWIARYAEWLVEADRAKEAEGFLMDEYDAKNQVEGWQVAQKLAAFYVDQGDPDNAMTWAETALEGGPDNPFNHYLKGLIYHTTDQFEQAEECYQAALKLSAGEQESSALVQLAQEALSRAQQRLPVDDEEEGSAQAEGDGA